MTTKVVRVKPDIYEELDKMKEHWRETYGDVVERLVKEREKENAQKPEKREGITKVEGEENKIKVEIEFDIDKKAGEIWAEVRDIDFDEAVEEIQAFLNTYIEPICNRVNKDISAESLENVKSRLTEMKMRDELSDTAEQVSQLPHETVMKAIKSFSGSEKNDEQL